VEEAQVTSLKMCVLSAVLFAGSICAFAQAANETGIKPYGSYHGGDIDQVNVSNNHLELRLPLLSYPQRGTRLKLSFTGLFHNPVWNEHTESVPTTNLVFHFWEYDGPPGVTVVAEQAPPFVDQQLVHGGSSASDPPIYAYSVRMADGSQHPLGNIGGTAYNTLDGTGMKWDSGPQTLTFSDGTRYPVLYGSAPVLEDTNGNQITFGSSITDTLGRVIPWVGGSGATQDFSGCTGLLPISSASLWTVPGANGSSNTFKFCKAKVTVFTHHWAQTDTGSQKYFEPNGPIEMLQSIVLPDQTTWTFDYSQPDANGINWGDLVKVTLPSGGSLSYTWSHGQGCHHPIGAKGNWSGAVLKRTIDAQDGTGAHTWTYGTGSGLGKVTDPLGNDTVHTFSDLNNSCSFYEVKTDVYQGSQSGGKLLKTVSTDYSWAINTNFPNTSLSPAPVINVVPIRKAISWPNGQARKTEFSYDSGFTFNSGASTGIYGKETVRKEFDYGAGAAGALLKSTLTSYLWQANSQYLTYNVLNVPSAVTVQDGSGNRISQSTIAYDGAIPAASGISTSHDLNPANGNVRGNATSISRWLSGSTVSTTNCPVTVTNGSLTNTKAYLDTGMVSQSKDACAKPTDFQYSSLYAGAYLTSSCDALNHCTTMDYDLNTGAITGITDPNGKITGNKTSYVYDDIGRVTSVTYPDGGQTKAYYPNPTTVEVKKLQDSAGDVWIDHYSYFDGLLRPQQTRLVDPEGDVYSETTYDELGRASKVTNPHRSTAAPTDGISTTYYDALSRVTSVSLPDANVIQTTYSDPNIVTLIDETGRPRRHTLNAFGRLIKVEEPATNGNSGTNATASLVIGGTLQTKAATTASPSTGSITFNGSEQSKPASTAKPGSASVSITGFESSTTIDPCSTQAFAQPAGDAFAPPPGGSSCPKTVYDQGSVTITVSGHSDSAPYAQGSNTTSVATGLAGALNGDAASPVTASASGSTVILTSKATGVASNYSFSGTSATNDATDFGGPSFAPSPTTGVLSGGADAGPLVYDSGTCSATINGTTYNVAFGQSDTTATIASRMATTVNAGTWALASVSGSTVSLTTKAAGSATNYAFNATCSYNSSVFSGPSFGAATSSSSLAGGTDPSPAATDAGTITLSISGNSATANYGSGTGQDSTASAVASDLVTKMQALLPASNPSFSISVPAGGTAIAISWNSPGVAGNIAVTTTSTTTQTSNFSKPSFASCVIGTNPQNCSTNLSGGADPYSLDSPPAWPTLYSYNLLGDLTRVEQHGNTTDSTQWRVRTFQYDSLSRLTQSNNPEAGQLNFTYDADGSVITRKDNRGLTITYAYDALHRLTQRSYSDSTPAESLAYDQTSVWGASLSNTIGRLSYSVAAGNTAASVFSYDPMGQVINEWVCLPSNCGTNSYATAAQYDLAGHLKSLTYPSGRTVTSGYNSAGRALNSVFSNFGSLSVNYPYYTAPQAGTPSTWGYNPDGSLHLGTFGNGISETYGFNNRQQLSSITASSSGQTWLSKIYGLYDVNSHNNGTIWSIIDGISTNRNQFYQYDPLGRVISGYQQDNAFNQTFSYDAWANMTTSGTNTFNPLYDGNNRVSGAPANCTASNTYCYDAAGNMLNDAFHQYAYDGDNRVKSVDSTGATYTYGAGGERVRKDTGGKGTEYVYFQGSPIAEKDVSTGNWSDYIFFNGRRIARANNFEHQLHISGQECANCGSQYYQYIFSNIGSLAGYTVKAGDSLRWLQWQNTGSAGGVIITFSDGTQSGMTGMAIADQNGEQMLRSAVVNKWNYRVVSLSSVAGKTITDIRLDADGTTQPGPWDIYYQDMVFLGADGAVRPLFSQNAVAPGMSGTGSTGMTQTSVTIHDCSGSGCAPVNTTTYFHNDQIGSARLLSEGYGYPVWQGTFTPFGQEVSPQITTNHYKFNGKERGEAAEGGLDYFGARYYSSTIGRWMTPDWSEEPSAVPYAKLTNPQSLNLYSYVTDDPLSHTDLDGHFQSAPASSACPNNNGDNCQVTTATNTVVLSTEDAVHVVTTTTTTTSYTLPDGASVSIHSGVQYDSQYSREEGHEGEYLGTATRNLDTTKGVGYDPSKGQPGTEAGGGYSSFNVIKKGTDWTKTTMTASDAQKRVPNTATMKMIDRVRPSVIVGATGFAVHDSRTYRNLGDAAIMGVEGGPLGASWAIGWALKDIYDASTGKLE
jgi:RHS repeat-associated protein